MLDFQNREAPWDLLITWPVWLAMHTSDPYCAICRLRWLQCTVLASSALPHALHGLSRPAVLVDDSQVPLQGMRPRSVGQGEHCETRHDGARRERSVPVPILQKGEG